MNLTRSIQGKLLLLAIIGPLVVALIQAWQRMDDIHSGAVDGIVQRSKAIVRMAENARENMATKLQQGLILPLDQLPPDKVVGAVPVITAMQIAGKDATAMGYEFKVPKISPRNPKNEPSPLERKVLEEFESGGVTEKIIVLDNEVRYFRPIKLTPECMYCHGDPKGQRDVVGGVKEGWKSGEVHGAFEIVASLAPAKAHAAAARLNVALVTLAILAGIMLFAYGFLKKSILAPLARLRDYAATVSGGNLEADCQGEFDAELEEFKDAFQHMVGRIREQMEEARSRGEEVKAERLRCEMQMKALEEGKKVQQLLEKLQDVAVRAGAIATEVEGAAGALSQEVDEAARGADTQSERTADTATAMAEMDATVVEVARNSSQASKAAESMRCQAQSGQEVAEHSAKAMQKVVDTAKALKVEMDRLEDQAQGISRVMEVISDVADQTNLLALNAAIEAARAGDAGRGFAVVADEVRKLAEKAMEATKEVGTAVQAIQQCAKGGASHVAETVRAIDEATGFVSRSKEALCEIVDLAGSSSAQVQAIATAAEEQASASEEIARAVDDIKGIAAATAQGMSASAGSVTRLVGMAEKLRGLIEEMKSARLG